MASTLKDKKVLAVGRDPDRLARAYEDDAGVSAESVDLTDDDSIAALADRVGARA
ncbi:MAG TPA: hypothetical protein VK510_08245 [Solirubrobacteraceae bacterium]|nr:hypothetical protein [Solirubrobacteraceae bacterium]